MALVAFLSGHYKTLDELQLPAAEKLKVLQAGGKKKVYKMFLGQGIQRQMCSNHL